ncbi:Hypothetical protein HPV225_0233 [Helicobacter pylori v225d]|nr:Hypothetical protein HPV225_0233 [Helicobacter pylori v225d]
MIIYKIKKDIKIPIIPITRNSHAFSSASLIAATTKSGINTNKNNIKNNIKNAFTHQLLIQPFIQR